MIRKIRLVVYSVAIVAGALLLQPVPSQAVLVERDLFAVGDGLIRLDTDTNLEWLDLTQTVNLSPVQIIAGAGGWTGLGFTYATTAQVTALFLASDLSNATIINAFTPDNFAGASLLLNLLGCTEDNGDGYKYGKGFAGPNEPGLGQIHRPWFAVDSSGNGLLNSPDGSTPIDSSSGPNHGHYLLRPIPEPVVSCVTTAGELQTALVQAAGNGRDDIIQLVQGTYTGNSAYTSTEPYGFTIKGGYNEDCTERLIDPANSILDAQGSGRVLNLDCSGSCLD